MVDRVLLAFVLGDVCACGWWRAGARASPACSSAAYRGDQLAHRDRFAQPRSAATMTTSRQTRASSIRTSHRSPGTPGYADGTAATRAREGVESVRRFRTWLRQRLSERRIDADVRSAMRWCTSLPARGIGLISGRGFATSRITTSAAFRRLRPAVDSVALPDENPLNGLERAAVLGGCEPVDFTSQWSPRDSLGDVGTATTRATIRTASATRARGGGVRVLRRNVGRRSRLQAVIWVRRFTVAGVDWVGFRFRRTRADAGLSSSARFSPTRRLVVSFGGGAIRAFTRERLTRGGVRRLVAGWLRQRCGSTGRGRGVCRPTIGDRSARWTASAGDAFTTDAGLVRVGGFVARPLELTLSAGYAEGQASIGRAGCVRHLHVDRAIASAVVDASGRRSSVTITTTYASAISIPILRQPPDER